MSQSNNLSHALYVAEATRRIEKKCLVVHKMTSAQLMTRAASAALATLQDYWPNVTTIHVFCGAGNNGGDGYTMAALAAKRGLRAIVWQVTPQKTSEPYRYALQEGVEINGVALFNLFQNSFNTLVIKLSG